MAMRRLLALALLSLSACASPPEGTEGAAGEKAPRWTYESTRDSPGGRGVFSGEDGEFTLDDLRRWRD
jgi:hypothetical protein